ncbi:MAG: HAD-IA family hydrolase [Pseudomonadota bacterium]
MDSEPVRPSAVVFDIGNVLIEWDPVKVYGPLIPDPEERAAFFTRTGLHEMNREIDLGAPFAETVARTAAAHPADAALIQVWERRWIDMASPSIPGSVALLEDLRALGVPVFALSNFGVETFERARRAYPFLDLFDARFISGHLRVMKPDPGIYEILEAETGHRGTALFFADDSAANVAAARARGWQAHLFEGAVGLVEALRVRGLVVD